MGEAKEVEGGARIMPRRALRTEVQLARLGRVEREPEPAKTLAQHGEHAPAALVVCKGHNEVIGIPHELAPALQTGFRLLFKPLVQHVVQENVGDQGADHRALGRSLPRVREQARVHDAHLQPLAY